MTLPNSIVDREYQKFRDHTSGPVIGTYNYTPQSVVASSNSTNTPLAAGEIFTGVAELSPYLDVLVTCKTDQPGTLTIEFSPDGTNWDTSLNYGVDPNLNETHRFTKGARFFRVLFENTSSSDQTYFRLYSYFGTFLPINVPLNGVIREDADAIIVRTIATDIDLASGRLQGYSVSNKFGRNTDIDSGSTPEDIWGGDGVYMGFPLGAPELISIASTVAGDTGFVSFSGLKSSASTEIESEVVQLNGTTPVTSVNTWYRIHTARYDSGNPTAFNLGAITLRHQTTTTNVFIIIQPGRSQSNAAVFTIPQGKTGYIRKITGSIRGGASATVDGAIWFRLAGDSPRLRRPFTIGSQYRLDDTIYPGLPVPAGSDIAMRVNSCSAVNVEVTVGFDIVLRDDIV